MQYSGANDERLPDEVRALPEIRRSQWVAVWNDTYQRCTDSGLATNESEAQALSNATKAIQPDALQFICNRVKTVRHETVDGKDFLVAPVVAIREGVLNRELVQAAEIAAHVGSWGGRPFTVGHPADAGGAHISANQTPEVLAHWKVGEFYPLKDGAYSDGKLRGEVWLDVDRARARGGEALEVLQRLEAGLPLEVSTAYFRDLDATPGEHKGRAYDGIARNLRPDHIAALLHTQGACSWADGCGAPRVNETEEHMDDGQEQDRQPQTNELGAIRRLLAVIGRKLGINHLEVDMRNKLLTDGRLGLNEDQLAALPDDVVDALAASLEALPAVNADQGNDNTPQGNEEDPTEDQGAHDPSPVDPIKAALDAAFADFGGLAGAQALLAKLKTNENDAKAALVAELAANERCAFSKAQLEAMDVDMLTAAKRSLVPANYEGQGGGPRVNAGELVELKVPDLFGKEK